MEGVSRKIIMSDFYNCHTLEELDEMHPCERHNMCGDLDLGPCGFSIMLDEWLNNNVPDEVLSDPSWEPKLLPEPDKLLNSDYGLDDIIETEYDDAPDQSE